MVTNVGWMVDPGLPKKGGAMLSIKALEHALPPGIVLVRCWPDRRPMGLEDIDIFVLHGEVYDRRWIEVMQGKPILAWCRGQWLVGDPVFRRWILERATTVIFNSPKQRDLFAYPVNAPIDYIHQPVDVQRFVQAGQEIDGRTGAVYVGEMLPFKGVSSVFDWSLCTGKAVDYYGKVRMPSILRYIEHPSCYRGTVEYEDMPDILAGYEIFLSMPRDGDLCSRIVVEAYAAGCKLILNGDEHALQQWLNLDASQNAPKTFWNKVEEVMSYG